MTDAGPTQGSQRDPKVLRHFLDRDPNNLPLIAEAASAAYGEGDLEQSAGLIERFAALAPLPVRLRNLRGLIALSRHRFDQAIVVFEELLRDSPSDPGLRFNLAWSKAMLGDFEAASELIDSATADAAPQAALLKIKSLHHLGRPHDAIEFGAAYATGRPADPAVMAALASAALDARKPELARRYAVKASGAADGLAVLGMLALNDLRPSEAEPLFERALGIEPENPRAWLGKGLVQLTAGHLGEAAASIDRAAGLFQRHLGSWAAAGWAYVVQGDHRAGRERFERALALDDSFAEAQGALAVLDIMEGRLDQGRRRTQVALRLDRNCLSAALANSLVLTAAGDQAPAHRIREAALKAPVGPNGRSILEMLASLGPDSGKPRTK